MKKIFTLLTLMLMSLSTWAAGETFMITFNGANAEFKDGTEVTAGTYFTWNSAKHNFNAKFTGCTWNGIEFTKGLKMEGATRVQFGSTAEATVTIVQSNWSTNTIKFDGEELPIANAEAITGGYVHTLTGVAAGEHKIERGSGENGIFAVQVVYTGESKVKLTAPEITADAATGQVTIGAVANAKEIRYTIDGSDPTEENGEVYAAPFKVEDGIIVKAIAIGTGSYINSDIASKQVLLTATIPVAPEFKSQAGAVAITCATPAVEIEYSIDGGEYVAYKRAFYIAKDCQVSARAKRDAEHVSEVANFDAKAIAQPNDVETYVLTVTESENANSVDDSNGLNVTITGNAEKNYSTSGSFEIGGVSYYALKLSNGAQNTLTLPTGKKAVRLTIYSYVNNAGASASVCGWKEVNGVEYTYSDVPMGAFSDEADYLTNPDIRTYLIDGQNKVTFTNAGNQLCFVLVVDVATDKTIIPTGINSVKAAQANDDAVYNLAGQKVSESYKGIVIKNGKKVIK